jgi:uncharacterized protein (DUF1499 family)
MNLSAGFTLGLLSIIFILISGPGTRLGLFPFTAGLLFIALGSLSGLTAMVFSVKELITGTDNFSQCVAGFILGSMSFDLIAFTLWNGRKAPVIHEISTDTATPPAFVAILPLRKDAINPSEYGGPEVAKKQLKAFPDIKTIHLKFSEEKAFKKSVEAVQTLKWKIVDQNKEDGRIESFDTTFWFGFIEDVVIRIKAEDQGSKVDIRSLSRVGGGDLGTNANRVRKFIKLMNE